MNKEAQIKVTKHYPKCHTVMLAVYNLYVIREKTEYSTCYKAHSNAGKHAEQIREVYLIA